MAYLKIRVPAQHADGFRAALLGAHARCSDELGEALARYRATHDGLDALEGALVEVRDLHDAIEQLGWSRAARRGPVDVTLHPEVLDEAIRALRRDGEAPRWLTDHGGT